MSKARELLKRFMHELTKEELCSVPDELQAEIEELLAQPEEEGVYQKILRIEDGIEVEILPSELWQDGYETGKRSMQPEQDPVAWMSINNNGGISIDSYYDNHKDYVPLYTAPPKRETLSDKEITKNTPKLIHIGERLAFHAGVRFAEKHHGIGGGG